MNKMIIRYIMCLVLAAVGFIGPAGCAPRMPSVQSVQFTSEDLGKAEAIARQFALDTLHIPQDKLAAMKAKVRGYEYSKATECTFHFIDPAVYPQWESITTMVGGFPDYFRISVDMKAMKVSRYYTETSKN